MRGHVFIQSEDFVGGVGVRRHELYVSALTNKLSDLGQVTSACEFPFEIDLIVTRSNTFYVATQNTQVSTPNIHIEIHTHVRGRHTHFMKHY